MDSWVPRLRAPKEQFLIPIVFDFLQKKTKKLEDVLLFHYIVSYI